MSDQSQAQRLLAANKARLGLDPSRHVAKVLEIQPDFSVRHWVAIQPFTNEKDRIDYEEALLMEGLPPWAAGVCFGGERFANDSRNPDHTAQRYRNCHRAAV